MLTPDSRLVAVLDMGASAIRLIIAEATPGQPPRIIEEASRGLLLGRDSFSTGVIRRETIDATFKALEGFRAIMDGYRVGEVRAVATSAVREARNSDIFLDRVRRRTGIVFQTINEAEESRLSYVAVRHLLKGHPALTGRSTLLMEVGGGSTSLSLLSRGEPRRSGVYALGAVRLRQRLDLRRHPHDLQVALLKRAIATIVEEIRLEIPLGRVTQLVALGGDVRFVASQLEQHDSGDGISEIPREAFLAFCHDVEPLDEDALVNRFRLPGVAAETLAPALLIYRALLAQSRAESVIVCDASLRAGMLLDALTPAGPDAVEDFHKQVLASAEAVGRRYRFDRAHGRHVAALATHLFDELCDEHGLAGRERLLLETASLLHDVGIYVSLRAHHKHSQYVLAASQIFGLSRSETSVVANIARYHRRGVPQPSHQPYMALDRKDQLIVNKLAAILRLANALDAEHAGNVRAVRLLRHDDVWTLELKGTGELTMEQTAASARADMFTEVFGRQLVIRRMTVEG